MALILKKGLGQSGSLLTKGLLGQLGSPPNFVSQGFLDRFPINELLGREAVKNSGIINTPGTIG